MKNWRWISESAARVLNNMQIVQHGGAHGMRDEALLESALARAQNLAAYGEPSVFDLAAAYAFGIISNHPFLDGNKRTGLLCALVFLEDNGWEHDAPKDETYMIVMALTQKEIDEKAFSNWLKAHATKIAE